MKRAFLVLIFALFAAATSYAGTIVRTNTPDGGAEFDHGSGIVEHATNQKQANDMEAAYKQQGHKVVLTKLAPKSNNGNSSLVAPVNACKPAGTACTFSNDCCGKLFCRGEIGKRTCSNIGDK